MDNNNPKIDPPIKDTNGDGKLSGSEIAEQLAAEKPDGRVHGVLNWAVRFLTGFEKQLNNMRELAQKYKAEISDKTAPEIKDIDGRYAVNLQNMMEGVSGISNYDSQNVEKKSLENIATKQQIDVIGQDLPKEDRNMRLAQIDTNLQLNLAALKSFSDFTGTSATTFPNGYRFKAEDVKGIMESFLPPTTPAASNDGKIENKIDGR